MESVGGEIFLSFDWCRLWWKYYGKDRELKIMLFTNSARIVAILPVFYEKLRIGPVCLRVVKFVGTDFMPITISLPIHRDYLEKVVPIFLEEIIKVWSWDVLYIGAISGRYAQTNELTDTLSNALNGSHAVRCVANDVQTYYEVADSLEEQIAGLSPRQRTKTRRVYKELSDKGIALSTIVAEDQVCRDFLEDFINLHQSHWQRKGIAGHFVDWPSAQELHQELAAIQIKHNRLRLLKIMLDNRCIGYEYIYKFGDTYCWFLSARNKLSELPHVDFHRIAFGEKVMQAIKDCVKHIDAMRGRYEYKILMGGKLHPIHSITVKSEKAGSYVRYQLFHRLAWFVNVVYMKIWRRRLVPRLRIAPRPLWDLWIRTCMFAK